MARWLLSTVGGSCAVAGANLRQVLPYRHQLDPVGGARGRQAVQFGQRGDVRRLVEHDQERGIQGLARACGLRESMGEDLLGQRLKYPRRRRWSWAGAQR